MACSANQGNPDTAKSVYEFTVNDIKGEPVSMEKYKGHVLIIVNVASKCGYTAKHYAELNELYDQYAESKGECDVNLSIISTTPMFSINFIISAL
jgi:succinyl-CoA synthetase alpha subunit